jgi:hypothetical protein
MFVEIFIFSPKFNRRKDLEEFKLHYDIRESLKKEFSGKFTLKGAFQSKIPNFKMKSQVESILHLLHV